MGTDTSKFAAWFIVALLAILAIYGAYQLALEIGCECR